MTIRNRIAAVVAVTLGVAAGASPALARPFDINSHGSYVPAGSVSMHVQPAGSSNHHSQKQR